jgi:hypothetical protein
VGSGGVGRGGVLGCGLDSFQFLISDQLGHEFDSWSFSLGFMQSFLAFPLAFPNKQ